MESGASKRIDSNEVVVRLVNQFVENRDFVQDSVGPVDQKLADNNEQGNRDRNPSPAILFHVVIHLTVFGEMTGVDPRSCQARGTDTVEYVPLDLIASG